VQVVVGHCWHRLALHCSDGDGELTFFFEELVCGTGVAHV
jgi:hypothetical protein